MHSLIRYKHIHQDRDRHGNVRVYFQRRPGRKVRLRDPIGSPAFAAAYNELLQLSEAGSLIQERPRPFGPSAGTLAALARDYMASRAWRELDRQTQATRRNLIHGMLAEPVRHDSTVTYTDFPLDRLTLPALEILRDRKEGTPEAANSRVRTLRGLYKWALAERLVAVDIATGLTRIRNATSGHHTWTVEEVEQFEAKFPLGTRQHLALAIILYTGARRSDVVLLGRQHVRDGWLKFRAHKGRRNHPMTIEIPLLAPLAESIAACPSGGMTWLLTEWGKPFSSDGFGNWFKDQCVAAGLPANCSAHGLRKASATRAAENGATAHQLMSMFGWRTIKEAELYTKQAERRRLAESGMPLVLAQRR